ncbi:MAG: hypothetical protein R8N23_19925 [Reichenbachiella sp.]|uniref:hypothetical protein n=1 Tax=Reichenbachiella sp. TaxID=2184521 RepID=UPI002966F3DF|nr:hypothetical protein [Reichenbachiella sp.]MDW3212148.1 hypothetical protein [Reichenbachiella sp.]
MFWTIGGLNFSWSNLDKIHGDHLVTKKGGLSISKDINPPASILSAIKNDENAQISRVEVVDLLGEPYYLFHLPNGKLKLFSAAKGQLRKQLAESEAIAIAKEYITFEAEIKDVQLLTSVGKNHEYRERHLPAWAITFDYESQPVIYVDAVTGQFERVRHNNWRVFDWLWMLHTMDYEARDDFGNRLLKGFSILGLITVLSGFLLFTVTCNKREFKFLTLKKS